MLQQNFQKRSSFHYLENRFFCYFKTQTGGGRQTCLTSSDFPIFTQKSSIINPDKGCQRAIPNLRVKGCWSVDCLYNTRAFFNGVSRVSSELTINDKTLAIQLLWLPGVNLLDACSLCTPVKWRNCVSSAYMDIFI